MRGRDRIALGLCAATLGFAGLAFGGAVRWAAIGSAAGGIAAAIPFVTSRRSTDNRSPLLLFFALAIALTALQLVPLPAIIAQLIASSKLELVTDNARAWGAPDPTFVMASYDPPATLVELAKLCGYAAFAFAALRLASDKHRRRALAMIVVGTAVAIAVVAVAHEALGAREIYGAFASPATPRLLSPIINDNHLASLMAMAVPVALGLAIVSADGLRFLWIGAALTCTAVVLTIASRGGALGLGAGLVAGALVLLLQRRRSVTDYRPRHRRSWLPGLVIAGCAVVLLGVLTAGHVVSELASTTSDELHSPRSKYQAWGHAVSMLQDHPWLGTGHGAFAQAFTRWASVGDVAYSHVENSYLQTVVDWGIPGGLALSLIGALAVLAGIRKWQQTPLEAGALGALASLAVHELADFSVELPVVTMVAILLLVMLLSPRLIDTRPDRARARWIRGGLLAAAVAVCVIAATPLGRTARASAENIEGAPAEKLALAAAAVERHPADYLLIGRAAEAMMELGDQRTFEVINRALFLNPKHGGLHVLAAAVLIRAQRPEQAQAELALAVHFAPPNAVRDIVATVLATFPDPEQAAHALPLDPGDAPGIVQVLVARGHPRIQLAYTQRVANLNPSDSTAQLLFARAAITAKQGELALPAARAAHTLQPDLASVSVLADAMALAGDVAGAIAILRATLASGIHTPADRATLLCAVADLQLGDGALAAAAATLDELSRIVADKRGRIALHLRQALLHDRRGETNQAAWQRGLAGKLQSGDGP